MDRVFRCKPSYTKIYDPTHYRVVFLSGAPIWIPFLQELAKDKRFEVVWVVTMPDKARDRWHKIQENVIKIEAWKLKIDCTTPTKLNPKSSEEGKHFAEWLKNKDVDYLITIAYGKIIPQAILDIAKIKSVNVHGSLLPKYRGASPIQSVFLNNEKESWLTIMEMVKEMDAGPIIDSLKIKLKFHWTAKNLINAFQEKWPTFLNNTLWKYGKKILWEVRQNKNAVTFCSKIEKWDAEIDLTNTSLEEVYNKYRAYALWPKIFFFLWNEFGKHQGKRIVIEEMVLDEERFSDTKIKMRPVWGGPVSKLNSAITTLIVKPAGKNPMSWEDFIKWYKH